MDVKSWAFWRRVLLFVSGVLTLAGQMLTVTAQQGQWLAFGVAVISLAASLLPDAPTQVARSLMSKGD